MKLTCVFPNEHRAPPLTWVGPWYHQAPEDSKSYLAGISPCSSRFVWSLGSPSTSGICRASSHHIQWSWRVSGFQETAGKEYCSCECRVGERAVISPALTLVQSQPFSQGGCHCPQAAGAAGSQEICKYLILKVLPPHTF